MSIVVVVVVKRVCEWRMETTLLSGNFLVPKDWRRSQPSSNDDVVDTSRVPLTLIDYEYSCYGPRGFDLANHFVEYAGFDCDWSLLPAVEQRRAFFAAYLQAGGGRDLRHVVPKDETLNDAAAEAAEGETEGADAEEEARELEAMLSRLEREVDAFTPVSHLWQGRAPVPSKGFKQKSFVFDPRLSKGVCFGTG